MTLVLVIGLASVVSLLVLGASRRALFDERQSVRNHQQALDTLRSIGNRRSERATHDTASRVHGRGRHGAPGDRTNGAKRAVSNDVTRADSNDIPGRAPANASYHAAMESARRVTTRLASSGVRARGRDALVDPPRELSRRNPAEHLVFDDGAGGAERPDAGFGSSNGGGNAAGPSERPARAGVRPPVNGIRLRTERLGLTRGSPALAAAAVVVVVIGAIIGAIALSGKLPHHSPSAAVHHPVTRPATHIPVDAVLVPVTSTSSFDATYKVPTSSYDLKLTASGPCWVYITDSSGKVLWTDTLSAGQTQSVPAQGQTQVQLGSASVTVSAGGSKVQFPDPFHAPFVATFTPG
ncbi:MAG TPA: DUF4115 domain-containing protein [Acidimicrobiales bacterium]|nr:DUF4115 domain-containing protein [Acidimicrobiales bacterium]